MGKCVQYGLFSNCSNKCDFCILRDKNYKTLDEIILELNKTITNIEYIDWKDEFSGGISLLGGELYFMNDSIYQETFLKLIDVIIEKIIKVSPNTKYSTVTNGIYEPTFLFKVFDRFKETVGMSRADVNFSFDLKYRFKNDSIKQKVLDNIIAFSERYDYGVGVQMVLTQYIIDMIKDKTFDINDFEQNTIKGNLLAFLYPHAIRTGVDVQDFFFKQSDFLWFYEFLRSENPRLFYSFTQSCINSGTYKYSGLLNKGEKGDDKQAPILSGSKELRMPQCGHSVMYRCYSDTSDCMLCDILNMN